MPVILLHGDNSLEIGEEVAAVRSRFHPAGVITFDGEAAPLPAIAEACMTAGLFDPERLVIVHDLHKRGGKRGGAENEDVAQIIASVAPTTTLLLISPDMAESDPLLAAVDRAAGAAQRFAAPGKRELPRWIVERGKRLGIPVDPDAADLLADLLGANPVMLDTELGKLATYAGEGARITPAIVDALVGAVTQESIFSLVDAIAAGNQAVAFRLLRAQLEHASSNPVDVALYLIRMLARQIRILLRIRLGQESGRSTRQLSTELRLPRYYEERYFRQARRLSRDRLQGAFEQLAALEYGLKSGTADAALGLDLLVAELCA